MKKLFRKNRRTTGEIVYQVVLCFIMVILMLFVLYPIYYLIIVSISGNTAVNAGQVVLYPKQVTFKAYLSVLEDHFFLNSYLNSIIITTVGTTVNMVMTMLCAYPLSRKDFQGNRFFTIIVAFTMFFSGGMIPTYLLVSSLGLLNSFWAIILPWSINVFNMIVMRSFFQSIPLELTESAHMDGANDIVVFVRVVIPLSMSIIATMVLFYAVSHWNAYFNAMLYLTEKSKYPVQMYVRAIVLEDATEALQQMSSSVQMADQISVSQKSTQYAVIIASILPILLIYPFVSKYFEKGVMMGSLKG